MFCRNCGAKLEDGAKFCTLCGKEVIYEKTELKSGAKGKTLDTDREKVFHPGRNSGIVSLGIMLGMLLAAILLFHEYSELSQYLYEKERSTYFILGMVSLVLAVESFLVWLAKRRVILYISKNIVSGVTTKMFFSQKFEYEYNEITEVADMLGTLQIRVNGKWVVIPGIENRKLAKKMIEERMLKNK